MRLLKKNKFQEGGVVSTECPESTLNPQLDVSNREQATANPDIGYNPAGGTQENACGNCALFDVSQRMQQCMQEGGETVGHCWTNQFKCEASAVCNKWEQGGPITDDQMSYEMGSRYQEEPQAEPSIEEPQVIEPVTPELQTYRMGGAVLPRARTGWAGSTDWSGEDASFKNFVNDNQYNPYTRAPRPQFIPRTAGSSLGAFTGMVTAGVDAVRGVAAEARKDSIPREEYQRHKINFDEGQDPKDYAWHPDQRFNDQGPNLIKKEDLKNLYKEHSYLKTGMGPQGMKYADLIPRASADPNRPAAGTYGYDQFTDIENNPELAKFFENFTNPTWRINGQNTISPLFNRVSQVKTTDDNSSGGLCYDKNGKQTACGDKKADPNVEKIAGEPQTKIGNQKYGGSLYANHLAPFLPKAKTGTPWDDNMQASFKQKWGSVFPEDQQIEYTETTTGGRGPILNKEQALFKEKIWGNKEKNMALMEKQYGKLDPGQTYSDEQVTDTAPGIPYIQRAIDDYTTRYKEPVTLKDESTAGIIEGKATRPEDQLVGNLMVGQNFNIKRTTNPNPTGNIYTEPHGGPVYRNRLASFLPKAQNGNGEEVITYASNPDYFDNKTVLHDNPQYNEIIKEKIYAGTHGFDPSTGALHRLNAPVNVPAATKEMATEEWGRKSHQERFKSDTPAGESIRKGHVSRSMQDVFENPGTYIPGAIGALPFLAGAGTAAYPGLSAVLNAPFVMGSTTIPEVTAANALALYFAGHGATHIGPDTKAFAENPSLLTGLNVGTDLLGLLPLGLGMGKAALNEYKLSQQLSKDLIKRNSVEAIHKPKELEKMTKFYEWYGKAYPKNKKLADEALTDIGHRTKIYKEAKAVENKPGSNPHAGLKEAKKAEAIRMQEEHGLHRLNAGVEGLQGKLLKEYYYGLLDSRLARESVIPPQLSSHPNAANFNRNANLLLEEYPFVTSGYANPKIPKLKTHPHDPEGRVLASLYGDQGILNEANIGYSKYAPLSRSAAIDPKGHMQLKAIQHEASQSAMKDRQFSDLIEYPKLSQSYRTETPTEVSFFRPFGRDPRLSHPVFDKPTNITMEEMTLNQLNQVRALDADARAGLKGAESTFKNLPMWKVQQTLKDAPILRTTKTPKKGTPEWNEFMKEYNSPVQRELREAGINQQMVIAPDQDLGLLRYEMNSPFRSFLENPWGRYPVDRGPMGEIVRKSEYPITSISNVTTSRHLSPEALRYLGTDRSITPGYINPMFAAPLNQYGGENLPQAQDGNGGHWYSNWNGNAPPMVYPEVYKENEANADWWDPQFGGYAYSGLGRPVDETGDRTNAMINAGLDRPQQQSIRAKGPNWFEESTERDLNLSGISGSFDAGPPSFDYLNKGGNESQFEVDYDAMEEEEIFDESTEPQNLPPVQQDGPGYTVESDYGEGFFEPMRNRKAYKDQYKLDNQIDYQDSTSIGKQKRNIRREARKGAWEENPNAVGAEPFNRIRQAFDSKPARVATSALAGATVFAGAAAGYLKNRNQNQVVDDFRKYGSHSAKVFDTEQAGLSGQRGNFDVNSGIFRPNDKVISYWAEAGGEIADVDDATLRKLIAAGAGIEIL